VSQNADAPNYEPDKWNGTIKEEDYKSLLQRHGEIVRAIAKYSEPNRDAEADVKNFPIERTKTAIRRIVKDMEEGKTDDELAEKYGADSGMLKSFRTEALEAYQKEGYDEYSNCYSYAMNDRDRFNRYGASPGERAEINGAYEIGGAEPKDYKEYKKSVIQGIEADGAIFAGKNAEDIAGYYKIAVFTRHGVADESQDKNEYDFHFIRQDKDGWSHKSGSLPVTDKDYKGNKITDPEKADIWYDFIGYALVPEGGLDVGRSALEPKSKPKSIEIAPEVVRANLYKKRDLPAFAND